MLTKTIAIVMSIGIVASQFAPTSADARPAGADGRPAAPPKDDAWAADWSKNATGEDWSKDMDKWAEDWSKNMTGEDMEKWAQDWSKNMTNMTGEMDKWAADWNKNMSQWEDEWNKNMTNMTDMGNWDKDWQNWENDWQKNQTDYKKGGNYSEDDWFAALINPPCQPECEVKDCEYGVFCTLTYCTNPCDGNKTCTQDTALEWGQWEQVDCSNGPVPLEKSCEIYCEYEDCATAGSSDVCWIETCDDGCGFKNCSSWYQVDGEWFGEYCDVEADMAFLPDFRIQDVAKAVSETGLKYQNTIEDVFQTFCPPGDMECLNGSQEIVNALQGKVPEQEPLPRNVTEMISQNVTNIAQMGAMQAAGLFNATVGPQLDMVLGNDAIKGLLDSFLNDTVSGFAGDGDQQRAIRAGEALTNSNNTQELVQNVAMGAGALDVNSALDIVESFIPKDDQGKSPLDGIFGWFRQGQKGTRGN